MVMPFVLPNGRPMKERLCIFGLPGIGKTHQFFMIAKWHQEMGSDAKFYGVNTDTSWEILYGNPEFETLTNIEWTDVSNYDEFHQACKKYNAMMRDPNPDKGFPGDWMCTDLQDNLWAWTQDKYTQMLARERTEDKEAEDLDAESLGELWTSEGVTSKHPLKGWDWQAPNAMYRDTCNRFILRGPGHRMIIAGQSDIIEPSANMREDDLTREARLTFAPIGVKPSGQKEDPFRWHTVLWIVGQGEKKQAIATAKERSGRRAYLGRKMNKGKILKPVEFGDFFADYLIKIAGWTM